MFVNNITFRQQVQIVCIEVLHIIICIEFVHFAIQYRNLRKKFGEISARNKMWLLYKELFLLVISVMHINDWRNCVWFSCNKLFIIRFWFNTLSVVFIFVWDFLKRIYKKVCLCVCTNYYYYFTVFSWNKILQLL